MEDLKNKYSYYISLLIENQKVHDRKSIEQHYIQGELKRHELTMTGNEIIQCTKIAFPNTTVQLEKI